MQGVNGPNNLFATLLMADLYLDSVNVNGGNTVLRTDTNHYQVQETKIKNGRCRTNSLLNIREVALVKNRLSTNRPRSHQIENKIHVYNVLSDK